MTHLETFDSINENTETDGGIQAKNWKPVDGEGDYTITFQTSDGVDITADFKESRVPVDFEDNRKASGAFEMIPGTSSDGNNYVAEVQYKSVDDVDLLVTGFLVFPL